MLRDKESSALPHLLRSDRVRRLASCGVLLVVYLLGPIRSDAHDVLADYIQHAVTVRVGRRHIDLEMDLTFFELHSAEERRSMDTDRDGFVSTVEREDYLRRLAPTFAHQVVLRIAGTHLLMAPLYEPELDVIEMNTSRLSHHRLKIWLFTATPLDLKSGDRIEIVDRLWPTAKCLGAIRTEGRDGCRLEADAKWSAVTTNHLGSVSSVIVKSLQPPWGVAGPATVGKAQPTPIVPSPRRSAP